MTDVNTNAPTLVRHLMSIGVLTCSPGTSIVEIARLLLEQDLEGMVVLDENGHAIGIVDREDLVRAYASGQYEGLAAEDVMQDGIPHIPPDIPLVAAAQIMQDRGLRVVYLIHHAGGIEYPAAMLTYKNLLRHMAMEDAEDISDLGVEASRELPLDSYQRRRDKARKRAGLT